MKLSTTRRYYAIAVVFVFLAVLLWADLARRYVRVSVVQESESTDASGPESPENAGWRMFFSRNRPDRDQFAVIRDRNVLSPTRKAWVEDEKDVHDKGEAAGDAADRGDVQLLGVAFMGGDRKVLLRVTASGRGITELCGEGESVPGPAESSGPMFRVVEIGERSVRLEDSAGEQFTVSLFGHEREEEEVADDSIYTTPTPMFIVGDTDSASEEVAPEEDASEEVAPEEDAADEDGYSEYDSDEEELRNEQLVREGKLKKIETPFGPVYRKPDNESE